MEILAHIFGIILALYTMITISIGQVTLIMWIDNYFNNKKNKKK